jgi:hypothetical protein
MPDKPLWYQRVPSILATLESSRVPILDRLSVERLFLLSRRQAIRVLAAAGGYQLGRTFVVERERLISWLRGIHATGQVTWACQRRERVLRVLREEAGSLPLRRVEVAVPRPSAIPGLDRLPEGVTLEPRRLVIEFHAPVELLEKMVALTQALAADFDEFAGQSGNL